MTSTAIWAPHTVADWSDYTIDLEVLRSGISQSGARPAVGAGMDTSGARRLEVLSRVQDPQNATLHTIDPEAGTLVAGVLRGGEFTELSRASWTPSTAPTTAITLQLRGATITTSIDGRLVDAVEDDTWERGGIGLGCPAGARSKIRDLAVTAADGTALAGRGTTLPWPTSGECDAEGVLELAECSRGLLPPSAEWAFLRHEFALESELPVREAVLWVAASSPEPGRQFVARIALNGHELGTAPVRAIAGEHRATRFDVASALQPGTNALGIVAWTPRDQRVQAELRVVFADGSEQRLGSSEAWRALPGDEAYPALGSVGTGYFAAPREHVVGRAYPWGFDAPGFDDSGWAAAVPRGPLEDLSPAPTAPVAIEESVPAEIRELASGTVVIDLGGTVVGGVSLPSLGQRADLTLRFGEMLDAEGRVRSRMATGNHYEDRWELEGDEPLTRTWGLRVFRYVEIEGLPAGAAASVRAQGHVYPLGELTAFRTSDPRLEQVLALCTRTMVQNNGPLLVDSWSREREPYEADAYLQAKANGALSAEQDLASYSLDYLLRRRTWPTEWPFYLVLLAGEHYERFGDLEALARRRDDLAALLPTDWIDPATGLVRKVEGSDGSGSKLDHDIVDWPPTERDGYVFGPVNTVVNAIAAAAFTAMARIDAALGRDTHCDHEETARRLRQAMNELLWDEERGTYVDGLDAEGAQLPHAAAHAGAFASALGVAGEDRARRVAEHLAGLGMPVSVYAAPFLLQALIRGGRTEDAYALLVAEGDRSWRGMLDAGAGATMEAWNEQVKPNVSCAHPWGASPLFLTVESLLGIRPLAPGYAEFAVAPHVPDEVGRLGVTLPTVAGQITVDVDRAGADGAERSVRVSVPAGTRCRLRLDGRERVLEAGVHVVAR